MTGLAEVRRASAKLTTPVVTRAAALMTDEELVAFGSTLTEYFPALDRLQAALFAEMVRRVMLNPGLYAENYAAIERK